MSKLDSLPQLENGYIKIATKIAEYLARTYMSSYETQIIWAIFIKTYGFNKKEDWISNSQFVEMTGIKKPHISRTIKKLIRRKIVTQTGNKIAFQKDSTLWCELPKQVTVTQTGNTVTHLGTTVTHLGNHNKQYTKDNIQNINTTPSKFPREYLKNLSDEDVEEFYKKYEVTRDVVRMTAEKIILYCESKGKTYRNYRSTLQNWLLDKYGFRKTPIKERFDYVFDEVTGKYLQVKKQV